MKQIIKNFLKGYKQIGEETGKEALEQTGKIITETISPTEWLGDIKPMGQQEYQQQATEEEKKKQEELQKLRSQMGQGRNVEAEIKQVVQEKERKEDEEEREFLEKLRLQRERERQEEEMMVGETTNPHKKKKKRGGAFAKGKGKASTADMSATAEYFKKPD